MAGANYEYCPVCDHKALYVGEEDVPGDIVVHHKECYEVDVNARTREVLERLQTLSLARKSAFEIGTCIDSELANLAKTGGSNNLFAMGERINDTIDSMPDPTPNSEQVFEKTLNDLSSGNITVLEVAGLLKAAHQKVVTAAERAFGGCGNCYGKGYATVITATAWSDTDHDIGSPGGGGRDVNQGIKYCSCDRGQQLNKIVTAAEERGYKRAEAIVNAADRSSGKQVETLIKAAEVALLEKLPYIQMWNTEDEIMVDVVLADDIDAELKQRHIS